MSITIIQMYISSTTSIICVKANYHIMVDGIYSVYMHTHLYHTHTYFQALKINKNLTSTSGIIIMIRHDIIMQ